MVVAAAMPPAADATSRIIPSRRLIRPRPAVPTETALDVAITVTRLIAAATLKSIPSAAFRKVTRKPPPPIPRREPRPPATTPAAMTIATTAGVATGTLKLGEPPRASFYPMWCGLPRGRAIIRAGRQMFLRFFEEGLAQASYLVACERTREGIVVDPRRDVDAYVAAGRRHGIEIVAAIETHIHADFVSGARELAAIGARVFAGPGAALGFAANEVRDGERIALGDLGLEFLHTPGHTPEHVCVLVTGGGDSARLFTGDTLFVGAVGRPDLLGPEQMRMLAGQLYDSLTNRILTLDDSVEVHPGHGAGSLCGAHISAEPHSTIGRERLTNPMLRQSTREAFVSAVLADLPDTPPYFARMKRMNREGPALLGLAGNWRGVCAIDAGAAQRALEDGAILIDLRTPEAFAAYHPDGALNIAFGPRIGYWAGWVVPAGARIVLLGTDAGEASEAARQLVRVGLDAVI